MIILRSFITLEIVFLAMNLLISNYVFLYNKI